MDHEREARDDIRFNNELINHRLSWLGTLQGLLFAAISLMWNQAGNDGLAIVICVLGAGVALSIGLATYGANLVIEDLEGKIAAHERTRRAHEHPDHAFEAPAPAWTNRLKWWWWMMPGYFVPWLFLAAWVGIILIRIL